MHSRQFLKEDKILLQSEVIRLTRAMRHRDVD